MKKQVKVDQSRLLGFRIQPKEVGGGVVALGAKVGGKPGIKVKNPLA